MDNPKKAVERKLGEDDELGDKMGRGLLAGGQQLADAPARDAQLAREPRLRIVGHGQP